MILVVTLGLDAAAGARVSPDCQGSRPSKSARKRRDLATACKRGALTSFPSSPALVQPALGPDRCYRGQIEPGGAPQCGSPLWPGAMLVDMCPPVKAPIRPIMSVAKRSMVASKRVLPTLGGDMTREAILE